MNKKNKIHKKITNSSNVLPVNKMKAETNKTNITFFLEKIFFKNFSLRIIMENAAFSQEFAGKSGILRDLLRRSTVLA